MRTFLIAVSDSFLISPRTCRIWVSSTYENWLWNENSAYACCTTGKIRRTAMTAGRSRTVCWDSNGYLKTLQSVFFPQLPRYRGKPHVQQQYGIDYFHHVMPCRK